MHFDSRLLYESLSASALENIAQLQASIEKLLTSKRRIAAACRWWSKTKFELGRHRRP